MWNISPSMATHEQKVIQTLVPNVQTMAKSKRNESTRKAKDKELKNQKKSQSTRKSKFANIAIPNGKPKQHVQQYEEQMTSTIIWKKYKSIGKPSRITEECPAGAPSFAAV